MALPSSVVWEVRASGGVDTNGGGWVPGSSGSDLTQQNSAAYAVTDGVTAGSTTITSATASFGTDVVGNLVYVAGGTGSVTGDWYRIVSRSNATTIVVDRSTGLSAGTGVTLNIGGAMATLFPLITRNVSSTTHAVNGNTIYLKGTLTLTSSMLDYDCVIFTLIGYGSTRGDGVKAVITTATNSTYLLAFGNGSVYAIFQNITFSNSAGTRAQGVWNGNNAVYYISFQNCLFDGCSLGYDGGSGPTYHMTCWNTEVKNCVSHGLMLFSLASVQCIGSYVHDNGGDGVSVTATSGIAGSLKFIYSVTKSNGGSGIKNVSDNQGNQAVDIAFINSAALNNTGDGITQQGSGTQYGQQIVLQNAIIDSNGGFGVNLASSPTGSTIPVAVGGYNAFRSNSSGDINGFAALVGDITLSADPFTNRAAGDFTLNNTAGGGADCRAAGFQSTLLG